MKRGIHGPGQCVLCKMAEENNFHLLFDCPIAVQPLMQKNTMDKEIAPRKSAPHISCPAGYVDGAA